MFETTIHETNMAYSTPTCSLYPGEEKESLVHTVDLFQTFFMNDVINIWSQD